jgi:two-component system, OmpR family, KDP operon response regulator KdpE
MTNRISILMIEDELPIRRFLKPTLESNDFKVIEAVTGVEALALASSHKPDIILLDLGLPDMDGLEIIRILRGWTNVPIIVLTARDKEQDKIMGLDAGADDYLTKPFDVGELLARVRVALRHAQRLNQGQDDPLYETADFKVNLAARVVTVRGNEVHLTPNEYDLLALLIRHSGKVVTQKQILKEVWGPATSEEQSQYLRTYIHQLREKIEVNPSRPRYLITEPGIGYRLKED